MFSDWTKQTKTTKRNQENASAADLQEMLREIIPERSMDFQKGKNNTGNGNFLKKNKNYFFLYLKYTDLFKAETMLEKTLERPWDCKEVQPVDPKGDQSWIFIGRIDVEAETPITWPPDAKNWLIWKDPDAGKDWRQEEKGTTEDETGWMASLTL